MRYFAQPDVVYIDKDGNQYKIKENRPFEVLTTQSVISITREMLLDEIATRRDVFGEDSEYLSYKLFDHNALQIAEARFDLGRLKRLKVPRLT